METKFDHTTFMQELVSIRRNTHVGYKGDPVLNAEGFLRQLCRDMPDQAQALKEDLLNNTSDFSDVLGISPTSITRYVVIIQEMLIAMDLLLA